MPSMMRVVSVASSMCRLLTISMSISSSRALAAGGFLDLAAFRDRGHAIDGREMRGGLRAVWLERLRA